MSSAKKTGLHKGVVSTKKTGLHKGVVSTKRNLFQQKKKVSLKRTSSLEKL